MKTWQVILLSVFFGLLSSAVLWISASKPRGEPIMLPVPPTPAPLVVQVSGAVQKPGIYSLPAGSRVREAVQSAGGMLPSANTGAVNLAAVIGDGQKISIPAIPTPGAPAAAAKPIDKDGQLAAANKLININTATKDELDNLPGIGPAKADSVIEYREKNGMFAKIEDLMNVPGFGQGIFDTIKDLICVDEIVQ